MRGFIERITRDAGNIVRPLFGKTGVKYDKGHALNVVTEADIKVNEFLIREIQKNHPDHGILSEETGKDHANREWLWTIDPVDGTLNFARRIPLFAVMLSLSRSLNDGKNGRELIAATIYDVMHDELFSAEKGKGAYRNGEKIACSTTTVWGESSGITGSRMRAHNSFIWKKLAQKAEGDSVTFMAPACAGIGSILMADGRADWLIFKGGQVWDYAPGVLIMGEAGCTVTNFKGEPWHWGDQEVLAGNPSMHHELTTLFTEP